MHKITKTLIATVLLFSCLTLINCSSGGNDGGSDSGSIPDHLPDSNACNVVGLKIINGTSCSSGNSAVVKLVYINSATNSGFACTGSMISKNKVLTAAHCAFSDLNSAQQVPDNSITISTGNETHPIARSSKITVHPNFISAYKSFSQLSINHTVNSQHNLSLKSAKDDATNEILSTGFPDVAIIQLDRDLSLPTLPIYVSAQAEQGRVFSIFGYGVTTPGSTTGVQNLYSGEMALDDTGIDNFTAIFGVTGSNTCQGDSGGPAILSPSDEPKLPTNAIIGLTSLGFGGNDNQSCTLGEISVFTSAAGAGIAPFLLNNAPDASYL